MPKRKDPALDPAEQFERFKEAARKAELADDEGAHEQGFRTVAQPPKKKGSRIRAKATK
jgi:hypothetical protein